MAVTPTYPGVYIDELPSGTRTITSVGTSVAAFAGTARRGPVHQAVRVLGYADFERIFGGLDATSEMSYAVRQFFANGGTQAWIVRVAKQAAAATHEFAGVLRVTALDPGLAGNNIEVRVVKDDGAENPFSLAIDYTATDNPADSRAERFDSLSLDSASPRYLVDVVNEGSRLVRVELIEASAEDGDGSMSGSEATGSEEPMPASGGLDTAKALLADGSEEEITDEDLLGLLAGDRADRQGIYALDSVESFNLLCLPGIAHSGVLEDAASYCRERRAFLIVDAPPDAVTPEEMVSRVRGTDLPKSDSAAVYYPWIRIADPLRGGRPRTTAPSGTVAGLYARTDASRGVWKAPAGTEASLAGVQALEYSLTDRENGLLNPLGVNCLRTLPNFGPVAWGARTLRGADAFASPWKYIPVRRLALHLEESLYRGTQWVVFEPNDEPLWSQIRLNLNAFLQTLFRQGAFQGRTPREAYFVKCDRETTTQDDINRGVVNIVVGFAPLKPAEFVIIKIQQIAGQGLA